MWTTTSHVLRKIAPDVWVSVSDVAAIRRSSISTDNTEVLLRSGRSVTVERSPDQVIEALRPREAS